MSPPVEIQPPQLRRQKKNLRAADRPFDYHVPQECLQEESSFVEITDFQEEDFRHLLEPYLSSLVSVYENAIDKIIPYLKTELAALPPSTGEKEIEGVMIFGLLKNWEENFSAKADKLANTNVPRMYNHFRKDTRPFREGIGFNKQAAGMSFYQIPDPVFSLVDARAIEFLTGVDSYWLGKFITDDDTERRIVEWIREKFDSGDVPVGRDSYLIDEFVNQFADVVRQERWKIRRIVETTANRTRNFGNVLYLNQATIEKFEVVEVMDARTCPWCRHMNNQIMSVPNAAQTIDVLTREGFDGMPTYTPFATIIKIDAFTRMDAQVLQSQGFSMPPFHPHCRGRIIMVV